MTKLEHLKEIKEQLEKNKEYIVWFTSDKHGLNDTSISEALFITIANKNTMESKTIKILKNYKRMNLEYLMNKIHSKSVYKGVYKLVYKFLSDNGYKGVAVYQTSYGIGIDAFCSVKNFDKRKDIITDLLNRYNLTYIVEYSDAGWVYRYKFSKSKENINKLKALTKQ